jgi:hypothetical protein
MSAYNIIKAIEAEAVTRRQEDKSDAYELRILLRCGREIRCSQHRSDSYFLKVEELEDHLGLPVNRIAYLPYEAIDKVVPKWL